MKRSVLSLIVLLCLSCTILLAGCSVTDTVTRRSSGSSSMSVEKFLNGNLSVTFGSFSGSDSLFITPSESGIYTVKYDMAITDGLMTVNVLQGKELIDSVPITAGESSAAELPIDMAGGKSYEVKILATDCKDGHYNIEIIRPDNTATA